MSDTARHLSWEHFDDMIRRGVPAIHRVIGEPLVDIFIDGGGWRIGLRTPCHAAADVPPSPVAAITLDTIMFEGNRLLEVSTQERRLYAEFYSFCVSLADRLQLHHEDVISAVLATLANWRELLRPVGALSIDRQLGLAGEVWLLGCLVEKTGPESVDFWVGPRGEQHDFRLQDVEVEVKVTLSPTRSHFINGELQLMPSPDHALWILSLQLEPAGRGGISLPEMIDHLFEIVAPNPMMLDQLGKLLGSVDYRDADRRLYGERWQFRTNPLLLPVDDRCPKITRTDLNALPGGVSHRISDIHYRINVEGLGHPAASDEFQRVLPIGQEGLDTRGR